MKTLIIALIVISPFMTGCEKEPIDPIEEPQSDSLVMYDFLIS